MIDTGVANAVGVLGGITGGYHDKVAQIVQQAADTQAKQRAIQAAAQAQAAAQQQQDAYTQSLANQQARITKLQAQVSAMPDQSQQAGGNYGPTATGHPTGNVKQWIDQALNVLHLNPAQYEAGLSNLISHESGGNPNAINRWDSNAKAGHPSQGLMQTIPGTFSAYALPGYNKNILDPVSNIIAGARYALSRYGAGMLQAGGRRDAHGNYIGY